MIDENEFFRQATLRICGDLEIEQAMSALLRYLSHVIPADRMFLQVFDHGLGAMRTIAHATKEENRKMDLLTPLSSEARAIIQVIAATHRNLEEMVKANQFREDLWFRLSVFPIRIPPLRERSSDIPALMQHFIREKVNDLKLPAIPDVAPGVIDRLLEYAWPGNVRELANVVEREIILHPHGPLSFEHVNPSAQPKTRDVEGQRETTDNLDEMIRQHIQRVLQKTQGKIHGPGGAAELLGINANTLRNRMNKLSITYGRRRKG